jgi:quercetin dioxygenase-like cupin family protein
MPKLIKRESMSREQSDQGWTKTTLADQDAIGEPAMAAFVWEFEPDAHGPELVHAGADQLLYVIRGSGSVSIGDERLELKQETMIWMEPGDRYHFEAGAQGLEILQGYAPGGGP